MWLFRKRVAAEDENASRVMRVVAALQELQSTLHVLDPADKSEVRQAMPFATSEWLDGLALSCRPKNNEGSGNPRLTAAVADTVRLREGAADNAARQQLTDDTAKLVIILVGLPARGKSLLAHKLEHFLSWRGYNTRGFSAGERRRTLSKAENTSENRPETGSASFFDSKKAYAAMVRENLTLEVFDEALDWLVKDNGQVAIFDAANVSIQRRAKLQERASRHGSTSIGVVFLESIVTDPEVIERWMEWKVAHSADFRGLDKAVALKDLEDRIEHYEKIYETVRAEEGAYIKLFNLSATAHCRNIYGRMSKSVLPFLLAIHSMPRSVYMLVVPGIEGGGEGNDATEGIVRWATGRQGASEIRTLTSTLSNAIATATAFANAANAVMPHERAQLAPLGRIGSPNASPEGGILHQANFDAFFGERVVNLVSRLEPIALEIEASTQPLLIVAHEPSVRALRSFLLTPTSKVIAEREQVDGTFKVSTSTLLEFIPDTHGGYREELHTL